MKIIKFKKLCKNPIIKNISFSSNIDTNEQNYFKNLI